MKKYIKKYVTVFGLSSLLLFSLYGCKNDTVQEEQEVETEEGIEDEMEEEIDVISGEYIPESNTFILPLPDGNWVVQREEEDGISLQSEDAQSYIEIGCISQEDMEGAVGEIPETQEQLEQQILVGEVHPTVVSFERNVDGDSVQTTYTLKYEDGEYPYMTQSSYVTGDSAYTIIGMTQSQDTSVIEGIQAKINEFQLIEN